ncbi:endonuclease/exonuclease/phosphatase family protein [Bradymonas sediminis]|uniref:Endonuclease/exonuclease/phosphatase family protein n=1 Tax=Bradymonas sediminis TaxID=1548548 RepID=A0A2Z4FGE5_9DELT|nr:endonuclease/exonuclease/phosphatase family protein [Bradymonas sediminis]AWV88042.1 endonuclease/exonuclease/phosphatase family protein [Bradymonas sediminis]TDP77165.1 endonuclease/exonuclease/phosphatase family metal-dependent hydrolase [Bradymonas sediminis]
MSNKSPWPKRLLIGGLGALGILGLAAAVGAIFDPFDTQFEDVEDAQLYTADSYAIPRTDVGELRVMNWNAKFGGGRIDFFFDCHGDRVDMTRDEVIENLEGLAKKIKQYDPDILILQEIDIKSKRAADVDQIQWLLDHTDLNFGAYASQWRATFVPSDGIGHVDSGNGILSKWQINHAERLALPLIGEQDPVTQYFYLKRNILRARVEVPGDTPLWVANVHTAAFAQDGTKSRQIAIFKDELARLDEQGKTFIAAGDLNTVPPGSTHLHDFPDSVCETARFQADDYRPDIGVLDDFYAQYDAAIPLDKYKADNTPYFTHTTDKNGTWNRKLDYLFTNAKFKEGSGMVHQDEKSGGMETMPLSDHAPVTAEMAWPPE